LPLLHAVLLGTPALQLAITSPWHAVTKSSSGAPLQSSSTPLQVVSVAAGGVPGVQFG
jgi:hypothetical protein